MTSQQPSLALLPSHGLNAHTLLSNPSLFETYQKLAQITAASQLSYGKATTTEQIATKQRDIFLVMLKGLEIGMLPMQALDSIDVIAGKPALKPQGMLAQIKSRKLLDWMKIEDDGQTCTVTMKRKDEDEPYTESFGMADAAKMMTKEYGKDVPLSEKSNWKAQPKNMRKWRAVAACCRIAFPDVIQGMYTPEELGADVTLSDDGDMIIIDSPPSNVTTFSSSTPVASANGLGQKATPVGRTDSVEVPAATTEEPEQGDEPEPHWSEVDARTVAIMHVVQAQTGDKSLTWELIKTLVPGAPSAYASGKEYAELAISGWKAKQQPAAPKTKLGKQPEQSAAPEEPKPATPAAAPVKGEMICDQVRYLQAGKSKYLEFVKGDKKVRRYSREQFILEVGPDYATENGFDSMTVQTASDEPYSINPIQIFYETKFAEDGKPMYNTATMCVPVTDETALDQYFGSVDFSTGVN